MEVFINVFGSRGPFVFVTGIAIRERLLLRLLFQEGNPIIYEQTTRGVLLCRSDN